MLFYIIEIMLLLLAALALSVLLFIFVQQHRSTWVALLARRRLSVLLIVWLTLLSIALSISVLAGRTGESDTAILLYLHASISPTGLAFFEAITLSGASHYLAPAIGLCTVALLVWGKRIEAILLIGSGLSSMLCIYLIKLLVARDRPALWETALYWGSSFPSGHTLGTAACATAGVLCLRRLWPAGLPLGLIVAGSWVSLVGVSRLVLGVHWPTDVAAGICMGMALALAVDLSLEVLSDRSLRRRAP